MGRWFYWRLFDVDFGAVGGRLGPERGQSGHDVGENRVAVRVRIHFLSEMRIWITEREIEPMILIS